MYKTIISFMLLTYLSFGASAQGSEKFGSTLNLGVGIGGYSGYYHHVGHSLPVLTLNYELDVAKDFTLAPFISFYRYEKGYYWGDKNHTYRDYYYHQTVVPIGVKGTYYFDDLLDANPKWDFYMAGSVGVAIINSAWDADYYGDKQYYHNPSAVFLDVHIGTEYHLSDKAGIFLDVSSGVSTIGLAIH